MTSRAFRRKPKADCRGLHANRSSISAAFAAILCSSSRPSLLPRDSGEGGPSEREAIGWWKGRGPRRKFFRRQRSDESDAPSTTLRVAPPSSCPAIAGKGDHPSAKRSDDGRGAGLVENSFDDNEATSQTPPAPRFALRHLRPAPR